MGVVRDGGAIGSEWWMGRGRGKEAMDDQELRCFGSLDWPVCPESLIRANMELEGVHQY